MNEIKVKLIEVSSKNLFELSEANKETKKKFKDEKSLILGVGACNEFNGVIEIEFREEDLEDLKILFNEIIIKKKMTIKI